MLGIGFATLTAATSRVCAPPTRAWPSRRVRAGPDLIDLHSIALCGLCNGSSPCSDAHDRQDSCGEPFAQQEENKATAPSTVVRPVPTMPARPERMMCWHYP